jgi:predicted lipoprotein with Yx(FWY)xxD motif
MMAPIKGGSVKRICLAVAAPTLIAALIAGCGSSKKTTTTTPPTKSTPAATSTPSSPSTTAGVALIATKHSKLGTVLAGGRKRLTLYLFEGDKGTASQCSGACAQIWPPLTTTGTPRLAGAARAADLGTTRRADGTIQVTYKGHPLYYYTKDKDSGDAYGEGVKLFGAEWYVLAPSGNKIDKS